ncbi:MAG: AAA family ATPase [Candidatus Desantisbacteria bacterium]
MSILIKTVRVFGFRGLQNIEVELEPLTVLTGINNSGKTSFLKALQIALGNSQFISQDDFYISDNLGSKSIIVDIKIIPMDKDGKYAEKFSEDWEIFFGVEKIKTDSEGNHFIPLRTIVSVDLINNSYKTKHYILQDWPVFNNDNKYWFQAGNGLEKSFFYPDELPFFYMDAQRDILEDIKLKSSYLGRMISKIKYEPKDREEIEEQIKKLNEKAISSSDILSNIKTTLKELNSAMDTATEGVEITPFTKKVRDLNKGLSIYYADKKDSFSMEYHGMGTRSWSSLLTLKSFVTLSSKNAEANSKTPFFPIIALEEPEAHLHPNAQKKLYSQIAGIKGQKIISTHSPYIVASARLNQIRNFYKGDDNVSCGKINVGLLSSEDIRKIERYVINTRGELFFSKIIVFAEGETEEQALPILAEHYFKKTPVEMGINFVGVDGYNNYLPFLRVAENLKIPWFIFSDGEEEAIKSVKNQYRDCQSSKEETDVIVFLDKGNNFEGQLLKDGFIDEFKEAVKQIEKYDNEENKEAKTKKIEGYDEEKLYITIKKRKTQFGPVIAEVIIESGKELPPKIIELFEKIEVLMNRRDNQCQTK